MALAFTNLTSGTGTAQTGTVASTAYANNTLYILSMAAHSTANNAFIAPVGGGLTWTQVALSNAALDTLAVYCGYVASGASTGTVALDTGTATTTRLRWSVESVTGSAATAGTNGLAAFGTPGYEQRTTGQTTSSVTLGTFADATNNAAFGFVVINANAAITKEGTYTQLSAGNNTAGALSHLVEYFIGQDLAVTSSWTGSAPVVATAVEVMMAVAAGGTEEFFPVVVGA